MSGVDRDVVTRRLVAMRMLLDHLDSLRIVDEQDLAALGVRLQVERALTQIVNLAAEVNAHVAVVRLNRPPEDYRQGDSTGWSRQDGLSASRRRASSHQWV